MANVNDNLIAPDAGWIRYRDTDSKFRYFGEWTENIIPADQGGTSHTNITGDGIIKFKFYGTKLRIITSNGVVDTVNKITRYAVLIDGVDNGFHAMYTVNSYYQLLLFEKLDLTEGIHSVELHSDMSGYFNFNAIDINESGYLLLHTLTQKSNLDDMEIGDRISCKYTALTSGVAGTFSELGTCIANEIPITGSATPNGLFYFVKNDKGMLIADRVIQHSISWDALNTAKFIEGLTLSENIVPIMSSANQNGYIVTASSVYADSALYSEYKAFNGVETNDQNRWISKTTSGILTIELPNAKVVNTYNMIVVLAPTSAPKQWTFEGSNDNIAWDILDTRDTMVSMETKAYFRFNNNTAYKYYRINITANQGYGTYLSIAEIRLIYENNNMLFRSLSGGVAYIDANGNLSTTDKGLGAFPVNNEFNKYVLNSQFGSVWNNTGIKSWNKETPAIVIGANTNRVCSDSKLNIALSSVTNTTTGFRPMLQLVGEKQQNLWY